MEFVVFKCSEFRGMLGFQQYRFTMKGISLVRALRYVIHIYPTTRLG
jgi:hypothetical protein